MWVILETWDAFPHILFLSIISPFLRVKKGKVGKITDIVRFPNGVLKIGDWQQSWQHM